MVVVVRARNRRGWNKGETESQEECQEEGSYLMADSLGGLGVGHLPVLSYL